jgi:hypothetical protein
MPKSDFDIKITKDTVDVSNALSASNSRSRLYGFLFIICSMIILAAAVLFLPGKHGNPSMWHDLKDAQLGSSGFLVPAIGLVVGVGLFGWQGMRYARAAWASAETFHADHESIIIAREPWLEFSNREWLTRTYRLADVSKIRFAVIASAKGRQFWGLRFRANGRKWALPGLEAPEAAEILNALKGLGADVPFDAGLEKRVKEAATMRFGDTSWMDGSWMDHESTSSESEEPTMKN